LLLFRGLALLSHDDGKGEKEVRSNCFLDVLACSICRWDEKWWGKGTESEEIE
jgi:hypothetical protein